MTRKPRSDSKLMNLKPELKAKLCDWLLSGMSYAATAANLAEEFGIVTSLAALHSFYHSYCAPEMLRRRKEAVATSEAIAAEAIENPGSWDEAALEALKQRCFELILQGGSAKDVKALFTLLQRARQQDLDERKIEILEAQAAKTQQAEEAVNSATTDEEKQARLREIFGF